MKQAGRINRLLRRMLGVDREMWEQEELVRTLQKRVDFLVNQNWSSQQYMFKRANPTPQGAPGFAARGGWRGVSVVSGKEHFFRDGEVSYVGPLNDCSFYVVVGGQLLVVTEGTGPEAAKLRLMFLDVDHVPENEKDEPPAAQ